MRVHYEIRTRRDAAVLSFDNPTRAVEELKRRERALKVGLRLVKVTMVEEEVAL